MKAHKKNYFRFLALVVCFSVLTIFSKECSKISCEVQQALSEFSENVIRNFQNYLRCQQMKLRLHTFAQNIRKRTFTMYNMVKVVII